jgi:hypothetical protein
MMTPAKKLRKIERHLRVSNLLLLVAGVLLFATLYFSIAWLGGLAHDRRLAQQSPVVGVVAAEGRAWSGRLALYSGLGAVVLIGARQGLVVHWRKLDLWL